MILKRIRCVAAGKNFWLSASNIVQVYQFLWVDGTLVDESAWYHNQPSIFRAGRDSFAYLYTTHAKLFDANCEGIASIMCDVPASLLSCFSSNTKVAKDTTSSNFLLKFPSA
jgi:hypothetical protein